MSRYQRPQGEPTRRALGFTAWEQSPNPRGEDEVIIELTERYPHDETKCSRNREVTLDVMVIGGDVVCNQFIDGRWIAVGAHTGDTVTVPNMTTYYWNPTPAVLLRVASTPTKWTPEQHETVDAP